jgi:hypothetical protein
MRAQWLKHFVATAKLSKDKIFLTVPDGLQVNNPEAAEFFSSEFRLRQPDVAFFTFLSTDFIKHVINGQCSHPEFQIS